MKIKPEIFGLAPETTAYQNTMEKILRTIQKKKACVITMSRLFYKTVKEASGWDQEMVYLNMTAGTSRIFQIKPAWLITTSLVSLKTGMAIFGLAQVQAFPNIMVK